MASNSGVKKAGFENLRNIFPNRNSDDWLVGRGGERKAFFVDGLMGGELTHSFFQRIKKSLRQPMVSCWLLWLRRWFICIYLFVFVFVFIFTFIFVIFIIIFFLIRW